MIDTVLSWVGAAQHWYWGLISFMVSPTAIITTMIIIALVVLFLILRYQYKKYGYMWLGEGIFEMFAAGGCGILITALIYFVPIMVVMFIMFWIIIGAGQAFEKLVKLSVKESK